MKVQYRHKIDGIRVFAWSELTEEQKTSAKKEYYGSDHEKYFYTFVGKKHFTRTDSFNVIKEEII